MFALDKGRKNTAVGNDRTSDVNDYYGGKRLGDMVLPLCKLPECIRPRNTDAILKDALERALEEPEIVSHAPRE